MFFVKHAGQSSWHLLFSPWCWPDFSYESMMTGLVTLKTIMRMTFPKINSDLFVMAYATYVQLLPMLVCRTISKMLPLFAFFLQKTLELMEAGLDYQVLTNIFEIQILTRFGSVLILMSVSFAIGSVSFWLFFQIWSLPLSRALSWRWETLPSQSQYPYLLNQFQAIDFETLETISLRPEIKQDLRQFMDQLYEESLGFT